MLIVELLTECNCDTLEGVGDPNNIPIREVPLVSTDAAMDCRPTILTPTNWRGGGSDAENLLPAMSREVPLPFEIVCENS